MEFVFKQCPSQCFADFAFACGGILPIGEADLADDVVNDAFDDNGGVGGAGLLEEFGKGGFAVVFVFGGGTSFRR